MAVAPPKHDSTRWTVASKTQGAVGFPARPQSQSKAALATITVTEGESIARLKAQVQALQQTLQLLESQGYDVVPQHALHGDMLATQRATPGSMAQTGGGKGACTCAWRPVAATVCAVV